MEEGGTDGETYLLKAKYGIVYPDPTLDILFYSYSSHSNFLIPYKLNTNKLSPDHQSCI